MNKELNKRIDGLKDEIIRATQELIRIKSVETDEEPGMPFGKGVNDALEKALELGKELGFETKNVDSYAGHVEYGSGDELLGVLCHLDVVPEGSGWKYPPYGGEIHENKIYGRGAIDNKGPAVAVLYALKAIKDLGIELNKRVRVIFGTDEESGWQGLNYYLKHEEIPDFAFSPDAEFPVIHAEKGIMILKWKQEFKKIEKDSKIRVVSLKGGNAPNMVPDYCEVELEGDKEILQKELDDFISSTDADVNLILSEKEGRIIIKSYGVSAHGSLPEQGKNAISGLMLFLNSLKLPEDDISEFIKHYNSKIGMNYYGQTAGCNFQDDVSGKLIFNVGMANLNEEYGEIVINIRYPVTVSREKVIDGINKELKDTPITMTLEEHMEPLYVPKDDPLVARLMKVYNDFTGDDKEPIAIGGGTYARAIKKAVAFGPLFPGQPELAHQKDEFIAIEDLLKITKIYAHAILELVSK